MYSLKKAVRRLARKAGYTVSRQTDGVSPDPATSKFGLVISKRLPKIAGRHPFADMRHFVLPESSPVILDVGANIGQSVKNFKQNFPSSTIHCFEPGFETFKLLTKNIERESNVFPWNYALGSAQGQQTFLENNCADMSSFLELSDTGWGKVDKRRTVDVSTVDHFLDANSIETVDILKSDTQGYELEVFKGAEGAMRDNRIGLIYFEFIFSHMYENLPTFDQVFRYLTDRNFLLVSMYDFNHQNNLASWADALFINQDYYDKRSVHK